MANNRGFTLIELIVVVAIIVLLMAIIVPRVLAVYRDVQDAGHHMTVDRLTTAAQWHLLSDGRDVTWAPHGGTVADLQPDTPVHDSWMKYVNKWPEGNYVVEIKGDRVTVSGGR